MALDRRIKRLEESLQQRQDDDILVVYCVDDDTLPPSPEEIEAAKTQARAKGQQIVLMGELERWGR